MVLRSVILLLLVSALFSLHVCGRETTLTSPHRLAIELQSYSGQPQEWSIGAKPPMKYRPLFRWTVQFTAGRVPFLSADEAVYVCYVGWSLVSWWLVLFFFWEFTALLGLSSVYSWLATISLLLCSPSLQAYVRPIHTREDPLAYLFVILGLLALFRHEYGRMALASVAGVLTRETTLIVPLIFLIYAPMSWKRRLPWILPSLIVGIAVRLWFGWEGYSVFAQASRNWEQPVESLLFLFMTFGWMWPLSFLRARRVNVDSPASNAECLLARSYLAAFVLILGSNLVGGRLCENRISFILFPWVVPLAWAWLENRRSHVIIDLRALMLWSVTFYVLVMSIISFFYFVSSPVSSIMRSAFGDMYSQSWLLLFSFNITVLLTMLVCRKR